ncbi:MAG: DUF2254 domain-containing protein [Flavisolibacter sp.]|nr:DUF2254 domain-containing protein [Flavisolibacter sp.]
MNENIFKGLRKLYNKFIHSVAFFPAVMGLVFLGLAIIALELDEAGAGHQVNEKIKWLTLKDAATARTIVATITAGIISLAVFSFSMVMIVMNQAASQMSNRVLDNLIGNRFQKMVLGFYIGTIIYALLLLSNISEKEQNKVPSLSIYLLIVAAIFNIFLFVYFLHYITQSFRYEQLIQRIHNRTDDTLKRYATDIGTITDVPDKEGEEIVAEASGYFQDFSKDRLLKLATEQDFTIRFLFTQGTYVLNGTPFLAIRSKKKITEPVLKRLLLDIDFYSGQEIDKNPYYGFQHLMEVGVKALSPGINDPGTAVLSLNALTDLLAYRMHHAIPSVFTDAAGVPRIITTEPSFVELFNGSVLPIWDYGKRDRLVQNAVLCLLRQLRYVDNDNKHTDVFDTLQKEVEAETGKGRKT